MIKISCFLNSFKSSFNITENISSFLGILDAGKSNDWFVDSKLLVVNNLSLIASELFTLNSLIPTTSSVLNLELVFLINPIVLHPRTDIFYQN